MSRSFAAGFRRAATLALAAIAALLLAGSLPPSLARTGDAIVPPAPKPAVRPARPGAADAQAERLRRLRAVKSWGYQLAGLKPEEAAASPYDMLIVDATTGLAANKAMKAADIELLRQRKEGGRRLVVSYLSIGEAEDYRPDYFSPEYMTEDAPDWLMHENPQWKGNRIIQFCREGWQLTILGDEQGRNLYNAIEPSPLYRLVELGLDGVYLDRVDVYREVRQACPDAERKMVEFVHRLAAHARKRNPHFMVIMQNAEELVRNQRLIDAIDAVAREDLLYGENHSQNANSADSIREAIGHLKRAQSAGRPVFVIDYIRDRDRIAEAKRRIQDLGFVPYFGPRNLGALWLPGVNF